jgi:hypothetical protein
MVSASVISSFTPVMFDWAAKISGLKLLIPQKTAGPSSKNCKWISIKNN